MTNDQNNEVWRFIPGFGIRYEVSEHGRVCSYARSDIGQILRPAPNRQGYPTVVLGRRNTRTVHSLVAEAFIGPRPHGYEVLHLDGTRTNNTLSNLRYGTRSENNRQAVMDGRRKLCPRCIRAIWELLESGLKGSVLAKRFGVSETQISAIKHRKQYQHVLFN